MNARERRKKVKFMINYIAAESERDFGAIAKRATRTCSFNESRVRVE